MTFLPIVERELRVLARRRFTYWSRPAAAAFALFIFTGMYLTAVASNGAAMRSGYEQFSVLKWLCFALASSAGLFLTADALSEEKREGTIGLLFLTDLRGHDVVLGKLLANSLQAAYGLLAAFPIVALPLLAGGVTGMEFWRTMLIVFNTLFLSLSVGLWISSVSRDAMKALNGTLLVMLILLGGLPLVDYALARWDSTKFVPLLSLGSPAYLLATTGFGWPAVHWRELEIQFGAACAFLILSSVSIPRTWQEKSTQTDAKGKSLLQRLRFGNPRRRIARRRKLLHRDPIYWLAMRNRWLMRLAWTATSCALALQTVCLIERDPSTALQTVTSIVRAAVVVVIFLWVASQAVRFFVEAVQNGAMELLLVAPVEPGRIVRGQWTALWRTYLLPTIFVIGIQALATVGEVLRMKKMFSKATNPGVFNFIHYQIIAGVSDIVLTSSMLLAVAWFGMWMGLTCRKASVALLKTFCFVILLPWMGFMFVSIGFEFIQRSASGGARWPAWVETVLMVVFDLGINCFLILWARHKMMTGFREAVARDGLPRPFRAALGAPKVLNLPIPSAAGEAR